MEALRNSNRNGIRKAIILSFSISFIVMTSCRRDNQLTISSQEATLVAIKHTMRITKGDLYDSSLHLWDVQTPYFYGVPGDLIFNVGGKCDLKEKEDGYEFTVPLWYRGKSGKDDSILKRKALLVGFISREGAVSKVEVRNIKALTMADQVCACGSRA